MRAIMANIINLLKLEALFVVLAIVNRYSLYIYLLSSE